MAKKEFYNFNNVRHADQKERMQESQKLGICSFCRKHFEKYHKAPILKETSWWILTSNDWPYEGSKIHLFLVYKKHISSLEQINPEGYAELTDIMKYVKGKFKLPGMSLFIRSGNMHYTGSSVQHLHGHIIGGSKEGKNKESLKVKVGFKTKSSRPS